jgi:hypothetical protein
MKFVRLSAAPHQRWGWGNHWCHERPPGRDSCAPARSESPLYGMMAVVVVVVVVVVGGAVVVVVVAGATVVVAAVVVVVVPEALAVWAYAAWTPPTPKVVTTGTANPTAAIFFKNARRSSPVDSVSCWSLMVPLPLKHGEIGVINGWWQC